MTKPKLDPRTAAAEKRMMNAVLNPPALTTSDLDPKTEEFCERLLKMADEAEKRG